MDIADLTSCEEVAAGLLKTKKTLTYKAKDGDIYTLTLSKKDADKVKEVVGR